jgi:hypothetical protein
VEKMKEKAPKARVRIAFLEFMRDGESVSYQELADRVHGDDQTSEDAIEANVKRVNEFLESEASTLSFVCGSGFVIKRKYPE